jgi:NADH-quinone oxidoreductase subunit N
LIDFHALAPELILGSTVLAVLVVDMTRLPKYWTAIVGLIGLFAAFVPVATLGFCESLDFCTATGPREMYSGAYVVDTFSLVLKAVFLGSAFLAVLLSVGYLESDRYWQGEFYFLMLASVFGAVVMASSRDLVSLFVALELVTGPTFLMAGWRKGDEKSNEAALKYFIIGVLSSAVLLFGMSIVYGLTGSLRFLDINTAASALSGAPRDLFTAGVVLTLLGFAFKVSAVPFHFWTPDTYEGAPVPVTAYLSVVSKTAGFVGFIVLAYQAFISYRSLWGPMLWVLAALSMTVGNLIALRQTNMVRLLGYSSIAQGGFILVPFGAAVAGNVTGAQLEDALFATVTYLAIYAVMNLGAFAVIVAGTNRLKSVEISAWSGMFNYAPGLAALLAVFFMSLAGIPPFAGWYAKFVMFRAVMLVDSAWAIALAAIAVINSVIAFAYYAKVVVSTMFSPVPAEVPADELSRRSVAPSLRFALGVTVVLVVVLGVLPGVVSSLSELTKTFIAAF